MRDFLLPRVSGIDFVGERIADRLAELNVTYRTKPDIVENQGGGQLKAGDRAPDAELRDQNNRARRLFELFHEPRHVLLLFLGALGSAAANFDEIESAIGGLPDGIIDNYRIVAWPK